MLEAKATRPRILAYSRAQYRAWFGIPWDRGLAVLLLGADEIDVGDPLVRLARPPSLRGRKEPSRRNSTEAAERRMMREARADMGNAIVEVAKATRAARGALSRLRSAANDARASVERWKGRLVVEDENGALWSDGALEVGLAEVETMLAKLPDDLEAPRAPRRPEPRTLLVERAADHFGRPLAPRELAVVGVLAGVGVEPGRDDTIAKVLERERMNYAQIGMRIRRA